MQTGLNFKGLIDDLTFKYVFIKNIFLSDLINSYFDYIGVNKRFYFSKVEAQSYIKAPMRSLKNYYGDIIATLNTGEIINLEIYTNFNRRNYVKSYNYMSRLYSNQIDIDHQNYEDCKKVISLNFINCNYRKINKLLINTYKMKNDITNKIIDTGETELVLVRLDKVNCIPYNENEKRFIRWLRLINAKSVEELEKIAKGDKIMEHSVEYVKRYLNGPLNHTFEDYIADKEYVANMEGKREGIIETAKKLISLNIDIKDISKATGLSEKDLSNLQKSL